ncbi:MAG: hypothetical protein CVT92_16895 [Bacteroidetes bacterium HGW-Bacteroidetes-1]|jgi:hypothetical protein|nr:MAG: hypothetical protein CVT92_16895 [Bacteroidetes bacterium HGW-Bacteroidetes-1]
MNLFLIAGILLIALLLLCAIFSWVLLISGRFKSSFILPVHNEAKRKYAKNWFLFQSLLLLAAGGISVMRTTQLMEGHSDNVIENLTYGLSSLLLMRVIGEFKYIGLFRTEKEGEFAKIDSKILTPLSLILFILSLALVI